jgi:RNA polymerase sigma-70 factor (ECF subfamily)
LAGDVNPNPTSSVERVNAEGARLDESTIRLFLEAEYPRLVAAVALVAGSRAAGEDAVQEALARAWERSDRGDEIENLGAWVTTVALNLARSGLRRLRAERRAKDRLGTVPAERSREPLMDLDRAVRKLSRRQREAVVLHYYLGLPVVECAARMRVSDGTVKTQLHRARASLHRALGAPEEVPDRAEL